MTFSTTNPLTAEVLGSFVNNKRIDVVDIHAPF